MAGIVIIIHCVRDHRGKNNTTLSNKIVQGGFFMGLFLFFLLRHLKNTSTVYPVFSIGQEAWLIAKHAPNNLAEEAI